MEKMSWTGQITSYYNPVKCTYFLCIIHMEHNPIILSLALKTLDQNCNFLLTQKNFGQLGKIKWNFSNSLLIGLLKIIVKVFLYILFLTPQCTLSLPPENIGSELQLPIDTKNLGAIRENKMKLQQFFIDWLTKNYCESIPLYLGGLHQEHITSYCNPFVPNAPFLYSPKTSENFTVWEQMV